MKNIFSISKKNINNKDIDYSKNSKTKLGKRFLVFLLDLALFFIFFSLINGVIAYPLGNLVSVVNDKIIKINEKRSELYQNGVDSGLLEMNEDKELLSLNGVVYKEVRRSLKTYLADINYDFKGSIHENYEVFNEYSEENINYYVFEYRLDNLLDDNESLSNERIVNSFNQFLADYYKENYFETGRFVLKEEVALDLAKYVFEEDYSTDYTDLYNEYYDDYLNFYYSLIKDFETNDKNYFPNFVAFEQLNYDYYNYLIIEMIISYVFSFLIYFGLPILIFKKDQTFMMKMFKIVGNNRRTNKNLTFLNYLAKFSLLFLSGLFVSLIFTLLFFPSYSQMLFIGLFSILNVSIFSIILVLFNMVTIPFTKKRLSLLNLVSNEEIKNGEDFIIEDKETEKEKK